MVQHLVYISLNLERAFLVFKLKIITFHFYPHPYGFLCFKCVQLRPPPHVWILKTLFSPGWNPLRTCMLTAVLHLGGLKAPSWHPTLLHPHYPVHHSLYSVAKDYYFLILCTILKYSRRWSGHCIGWFLISLSTFSLIISSQDSSHFLTGSWRLSMKNIWIEDLILNFSFYIFLFLLIQHLFHLFLINIFLSLLLPQGIYF